MARDLENFLSRMSAILEVESASTETVFREVEDWCSLKAFGILVAMETEFGVRLDIETFSRLTTLGDLWSLV